MTSIPAWFNSLASPTPDCMSSLGVMIAPSESTISRRAAIRCDRPPRRNSTSAARLPWNTMRATSVIRLVPGNIWVNQQGRRFHNEALSGGNSASPALMAQSPRHAWAIMDTPMTATMEIADPYYRDGDKVVRAKVMELLDNSPFIRKADTL